MSGGLAIVFSLAMAIWAAAFVQRTSGRLVLILLSILLLPVGRGFLRQIQARAATA